MVQNINLHPSGFMLLACETQRGPCAHHTATILIAADRAELAQELADTLRDRREAGLQVRVEDAWLVALHVAQGADDEGVGHATVLGLGKALCLNMWSVWPACMGLTLLFYLC